MQTPKEKQITDKIHSKSEKHRRKFAGCSVAEPIGVLDLMYGSLVD